MPRQVRVCGAKRNNESPSGAFKRQNGLALARWRASPRQVRVCAAKWNNESPSGAFKRQNGLAAARWRASPRQVPVCRTALNNRKAPAFQNGCRGFFVYFKMISPFSSASTTRVPPEARCRRSGALRRGLPRLCE